MLKRRIIPIELYDQGRLRKTTTFESPRDVGDPVKSSQVYSDQDADELLFLNMTRAYRSVGQIISVIEKIARSCFVPLTVGGGIRTLLDAASLFAAGADKVVLNSVAYCEYGLIRDIAKVHGSQAIVVAIDVRITDEGEYALYSDCGARRESISLEAHIRKVTQSGAGEILIQSIDRDGTMGGYDLELVREVVLNSSVPIIAAGGAGHFLHLKQVFDCGVDAAACGSLFNFGDNNPLRAKAFLKNYAIPLKRT
jgi:imidazole glycerol-phosphate synthase subunit HisF